MSAWLGAMLPLMLLFAIFLMLPFESYFGKFVIGLLLVLAWIGTFAIWVRFQCSNLAPTGEKLTMEEWAASAARESSGFALCVSMIVAVATFAGLIYVIILSPQGAVGIFFFSLYFSLVAVADVRILVEKRRQASCPS
jgi:hypothetical protein